MTDTLQKQGLVLAAVSIACVGLALWTLWHFDLFSTTEDVNIVVQPSVVRSVVAIVVGLVVPQFVVAAAKTLGIDRAWSRFATFARNVASMPQNIDDIHSAIAKSLGLSKSVKERP